MQNHQLSWWVPFYIEFDISNIKLISASYSCTTAASNGNVTKAVYDVINFAENCEGKNNTLSASSWNGSTSNGTYIVNSASDARIVSTKWGNIKLTVAPSVQSINGSIQQKYGSNTSSQSISEKTTVTISSTDMIKSESNFYMDFSVRELAILSAKWEPAPEPLTIPKRSSVLDFSTSSLVHNSNLVEFGTDLTGGCNRCYGDKTYDGTKCWCTDSTIVNYLFDKMPYSKNDSYIYFFDNYSSSIVKGNGSNTIPSTSVSDLLTSWALTRVYFDAKENWPGSGIGRATSSSWRYLPLAGFTQPINTVLYNYVCGLDSDINLDDYIHPVNDFNRTALRQLTTDACAKLKAAGVKIYVIKYKAQKTWGALMRDTTTTYEMTSLTHDYDEIEACATDTGGKKYDISNESDLQNALTEIAADIKEWADYKPAQVAY